MAEEEIKKQPRVDTRANWNTENPVLLKGEIGIERIVPESNNKFAIKVGDGETAWNNLPYIAFENVGNTNSVTLTKPEYDALTRYSETTMYCVIDASTGNVSVYLGTTLLSSGKVGG